MAISEKTYKTVWGQFCARCCICRKEVISKLQSGKSSLTGEVAHIVGETKLASRGNSCLTLNERNDPENLILVCREHHKHIDDDEGFFTVEYLHNKKNEFIDWISKNLSKPKAWQSNLSQFTYLNVPRLSEQAELRGYHVDLSSYRDDKTLHGLGWDLNRVMAAFRTVLAGLTIDAVPAQELEIHDSYIGAAISFDRLRFRTKNIPMDALHSKGRWPQTFSGDLNRDPHIYTNIGKIKLVIFIDPNWITTTTAFTLFRPSSGQSVFSGLARITNVDYENNTMTATAWIIGLPNGAFEEMLDSRKKAASSDESSDPPLDSLVNIAEAKNRGIYFSPSPEYCDLCRRSLSDDRYMIDGAVKGSGGWACMCSKCFTARGVAVRPGMGQLYLRDQRGWLLVAGFSASESDVPD